MLWVFLQCQKEEIFSKTIPLGFLLLPSSEGSVKGEPTARWIEQGTRLHVNKANVNFDL